MSVRTALAAPLALGAMMMVATAPVARAQTQPPAQPTQPATQPPTQPPTQPQQPTQPATQQPPAQAATGEKAESSTFTAPAGLLLVQIKPDKTADYEAMVAKLKDSLVKSEKPERKAMAKSWKVYKAAEPAGPSGNVLYVHVIESVAPGDYTNPLRIISEVFPTEVQDIYNKVKEGFVQTGLLNLTLLSDLSAQASSAQASLPAQPAAQQP